MTTITDNFGVTIEVGDVVRIVHWGWAARLTDTGRTAVVTGFTRAGNATLDSGAYAPDLIANGRAVRPTCLGVLDRSDRDNRVAAGYEGNRRRCTTCGDPLDAPTGAGRTASCADTHAAKVGA